MYASITCSDHTLNRDISANIKKKHLDNSNMSRSKQIIELNKWWNVTIKNSQYRILIQEIIDSYVQNISYVIQLAALLKEKVKFL
jgi:hypothetical protein